jgi:hypothetical protein
MLKGCRYMSVDRVQSYMSTGFDQVPGWCSRIFVEIMGHLGEEMTEAGVVGGVCEIGVYQGKFFIGLTHAVDGRPSLAVDLFDDQSENIDNSGGGRKDMLAGFRENVAKYGYPTVDDMKANSFALTVRDQIKILDHYGPFQFFSIDGGHMAEHVVNDYRFAEVVTHHGGAIIIDDIHNPGWPGVMEGVAHLFIGQKPKFVPLLIGQNKLVLAGLAYHKRYLRAMLDRIKAQFPQQNVWVTRLFGYEMLSLV